MCPMGRPSASSGLCGTKEEGWTSGRCQESCNPRGRPSAHGMRERVRSLWRLPALQRIQCVAAQQASYHCVANARPGWHTLQDDPHPALTVKNQRKRGLCCDLQPAGRQHPSFLNGRTSRRVRMIQLNVRAALALQAPPLPESVPCCSSPLRCHNRSYSLAACPLPRPHVPQ